VLIATGSIAAPQAAARSPGESSTWMLQRQLGQWFRCLVPGASIETSSAQLAQRNVVRRCRVRDKGSTSKNQCGRDGGSREETGRDEVYSVAALTGVKVHGRGRAVECGWPYF
jgi:hypothetical protein